MKAGLKIFSISSGYYPWVWVGWVRRVEGDEWEALGARIIRRYGHPYSIADLATKGPLAGINPTELLPPAREEFHRLRLSRCTPANVEAWAKDCPRPDGWRDE